MINQPYTRFDDSSNQDSTKQQLALQKGAGHWQFINWYFESFAGGNPFGFGGIDIKSYFMGLSGREWSRTTSSQLPDEFQPDEPQTHNALDDARAQASIFLKLMNRANNANNRQKQF